MKTNDVFGLHVFIRVSYCLVSIYLLQLLARATYIFIGNEMVPTVKVILTGFFMLIMAILLFVGSFKKIRIKNDYMILNKKRIQIEKILDVSDIFLFLPAYSIRYKNEKDVLKTNIFRIQNEDKMFSLIKEKNSDCIFTERIEKKIESFISKKNNQ